MSAEETEEVDEEEEYGTTNSQYRWKGLATVLALFIGVGFPMVVGFHAGGYVDITVVPQWAWLPIVSGWAAVLTYALGEDIKKAWKGEV